MSETKDVAIQQEQEQKKAIGVAAYTLEPSNFGELMTYAKMLASSEIVPKDFREKPANIMVAIQLGSELGVKPIQALQNIAVINGRPCIWGDLALGLVRNSGLLEYIEETDDGKCATCRIKRKGQPEKIQKFSMEDAARAKLASKPGPWQEYPQRMRAMRARSWALRDLFGDVLKGLYLREEVEDFSEINTPDVPKLAMPKRKSEMTKEIEEVKKEPIQNSITDFANRVMENHADLFQKKETTEISEPGENG